MCSQHRRLACGSKHGEARETERPLRSSRIARQTALGAIRCAPAWRDTPAHVDPNLERLRREPLQLVAAESVCTLSEGIMYVRVLASSGHSLAASNSNVEA